MTDATGPVYARYRVRAMLMDDESRTVPMTADLIRGYSDFTSIPAIVAARYGVGVEDVTIVSATLMDGDGTPGTDPVWPAPDYS